MTGDELTSAAAVLPDFPGTLNMPHFDKLWMCLFARLGDLCVDPRPAVRKSAGQTLFSTISAHGSLLNPPTWQAVLWQVLFPLLDKVRQLSGTASSEKVDTSGNILIHHSRNTAQKQWAETQVLTLSGVARVFNTKRALLQQLGDFARAWSLLLEFIENAALSKSNEVSLAALKSFQEILYNKPPTQVADVVSGGGVEVPAAKDEADMWNVRLWMESRGRCKSILTCYFGLLHAGRLARVAQHWYGEHQNTAGHQSAREARRHLHSQPGIPDGPGANIPRIVPAHSHQVRIRLLFVYIT